MRVRVPSLLCELHAHTTWSDGELSLPELVDLYGRAGFHVLCVTDHVLREEDPWPRLRGRPCVNAANFDAYLAEIERESVRALSAFGLVLVSGLELTYNDTDPDRACHAVAVGLQRLVSMDDGPAAAMEAARDAGAAVIAAHPHDLATSSAVRSPTRYFSRHWQELQGLFDRVELFNGGSSSAGSQRRACCPSRAPTCIEPTSFRVGRRSFRVSTMPRPSSTTFALRGLSSWPASSPGRARSQPRDR
jgi:PHP domain